MAAFEQLAIDFDADPDEDFGSWLRRQESTTWPDLRKVPLRKRYNVAARLALEADDVDERWRLLEAAVWPGATR